MVHSVKDSPVRLRARPDLVFETTYYDGERKFVAKNPVSLKYVMLGETEYTLLQLLDGESSLGRIADKASDRLKPQKVKLQDVQRLLTMLHRSGLLVANAKGQGSELLRQRHESFRKKVLASCTNILSIRFPGIDPERFLAWSYPAIRWVFHPILVTLTASLVLAAVIFLCMNLEEFYRRLPDYQHFFAAKNLKWMMVVLGVTKVIHEFAHAYTCKHFGGECHKIGFMLLVFTPALYCDASDAWLLPQRWKRIAIAFAGMYSEFVMAAAATFVWWWTEPGLLHFISLAVMMICSVSTLFFNGNPLLRYDGYFILADLLRIPNLAQRSRDLLTRTLRDVCLGIEDQRSARLPTQYRWGFLFYAIASSLYRWFILAVILWAVYRILRPYELQSVSTILAGISVASILLPPLWKTIKYIRIPGQMQRINKYRLVTSATLVCGLVFVAMFLPLRQHVIAPAYFQPAKSHRMYVTTPGRMVDLFVESGQQVKAGTVVARLENADLALQSIRINAEYAVLEKHLSNLTTLAISDPTVTDRIPATESALNDLREQKERIQEDLDRLILRAPTDGVVLPPMEFQASDQTKSTRMLNLDERSIGRFFETGTSFCLVAQSDEVEAVLVLDQVDRNLVQVGQPAKLVINNQPWLDGSGIITETASSNTETIPADLAAQTGGDVETVVDESGAKPRFTSFVARCSIASKVDAVLVGMRGTAKVKVRSESLWTRSRRFLMKHFRFR